MHSIKKEVLDALHKDVYNKREDVAHYAEKLAEAKESLTDSLAALEDFKLSILKENEL